MALYEYSKHRTLTLHGSIMYCCSREEKIKVEKNMQVTFPEKDIDWTVKNNDVRTKSLIKNTNTKLWQKSEQCASFDKTESKRRTS